jgi:uncharacterized protein
MGLHPALHVKSFDTYGFPCKGLFVKPGHRIEKGEGVWWFGGDDSLRTFTKQEIASAPMTPMTMVELAAIGKCNDHIVSPDCVIPNPRENLVTYSYMLDDDCFGSTPWPDEDVSYYYNHSCDPNTGYRGDDWIVALREIREGEQVVYDYGFTETQDSNHYGLQCKCGAAKCRGFLDLLQYKDPVFIKSHYENCTDFIKRKMRENGWLHDSVVRRRCFDSLDYGLVACKPIPRLSPVIIFAGKVISGQYVVNISPRDQEMSLQIDADLWQIPVHPNGFETGDFINHSCDPNCGMMDSVRVITMRDISLNESLTLDYAMINSGKRELNGDCFLCQCGADMCRRTITGKDYRMVGYRYMEFLSPFVREKYLNQLPGGVPVTSDSAMSSDENENGSDENGSDEAESLDLTHWLKI